MAWLKELPYEVRENDVLFCHGSPLNVQEFDYIFARDQAARCMSIWDSIPALTLIGHSHLCKSFALNPDHAGRAGGGGARSSSCGRAGNTSSALGRWASRGTSIPAPATRSTTPRRGPSSSSGSSTTSRPRRARSCRPTSSRTSAPGCFWGSNPRGSSRAGADGSVPASERGLGWACVTSAPVARVGGGGTLRSKMVCRARMRNWKDWTSGVGEVPGLGQAGGEVGGDRGQPGLGGPLAVAHGGQAAGGLVQAGVGPLDLEDDAPQGLPAAPLGLLGVGPDLGGLGVAHAEVQGQAQGQRPHRSRGMVLKGSL